MQGHGIIMTIVIGFIIGILAKAITPGKEPTGFIITTIIGIIGSFIGTFLGRALGHYGPNQGAGFLMSLVGAIVLLVLYHLIARPTARA